MRKTIVALLLLILINLVGCNLTTTTPIKPPVQTESFSVEKIAEELIDSRPSLQSNFTVDSDSRHAVRVYKQRARIHDNKIVNLYVNDNFYTSIDIEVYDNSQECELLAIYYETLDELMDQYLPKEDVGSYYYEMFTNAAMHAYPYGNVLLRVNKLYTDKQIQEIRETFEQVMINYNQEEINTLSESDFEEEKNKTRAIATEILEASRENLKRDLINILDGIIDRMQDIESIGFANFAISLRLFEDTKIVEDKYKEVLNMYNSLGKKKIDDINSELKRVEKTLIKEQYDVIYKKIKDLTSVRSETYDSYFDDYAEYWNNYLDKIYKKIEK